MQRGFFQLIVIFILIIVIVSLLGIDLSRITENKTLRTNLVFAWQGIEMAWDRYILPYGGMLGSFLLGKIQ